MSADKIEPEHLKMIVEFGRSPLQKSATEDQREKLWQMMCDGAKVPRVPHSAVIEEWKKYVLGQSEVTGFAMQPTPDPSFISVGVTFKRRLMASHTMKTRVLLKALLKAFSTQFSKEGEFKAAVEAVLEEVCEEKATRKPRRG